MKLDSQKRDFLDILYQSQIYLTLQDFKPASELRWVRDKLPLGGGASQPSGWPKSFYAVEDPTTGYFFASLAKTNPDGWTLVYTPTKGSPQVKAEFCTPDKYNDTFSRWVKRLNTEIEAEKPWLDRLPLGSSPLTFGKAAGLEQCLRNCGLESRELEFESSFSGLKLVVPGSIFGFEFRPNPGLTGWSGTYSPGMFRVSDSYSNLNWGAVLKLVEQWCGFLKKEQNVVFPSPPQVPAQPAPKRDPVKMVKLVLVNIRKFQNLELELHSAATVLCGPNGTGKSTILRCLAIALCHEADTAALLADVPGGLLNDESEEGRIELVLRDSAGTERTNTVVIWRKNGRDVLGKQEKPAQDVFFCGYGSVFGMQAEQTRSEFSGRESSRSLFDYGTKLFSLEMVLRRLGDRFGENSQSVVTRLSQVLGLQGLPRVRPGGGVEYAENGTSISYEGLADGYRISLTWMLDLFGWALVADGLNDKDPAGVLLCDEVDKHMHPALQAELIGRLGKALPEMQMVLTTHNPLTVLGGC